MTNYLVNNCPNTVKHQASATQDKARRQISYSLVWQTSRNLHNPVICCRYTMVVLWGIVVPHIAHASLCDTIDSVTTTDPFSIMEKSDESQFFENMTIYLKTKKMLSQWTKQMRWRIKK